MARKRELKPYNIIYSDGTYQTFDFTKESYTCLQDALVHDLKAIVTNFGILVLRDIRTVVEYKEPEMVEVEPEPQLTTGIPNGDLAIAAYLRQIEKESEDAIYEGRMFY